MGEGRIINECVSHITTGAPLSADVTRAIEQDPSAKGQLDTAKVMAATAGPNWSAILQLVVQVVQAILPLLAKDNHAS